MNKIVFFIKSVKALMAGKSPFYEIYCKNKKVLDLGCGGGDFIKNDSKNIIGLDNNDEMISRCAKKGIAIVKGNINEKLPFSDCSFDVVYNSMVIEHLNPKEAYEMLKEVARILKNDGLLIISTELNTQKIWETFSHIRPYPPKSLEKMFSLVGNETFPPLNMFKIEEVFYNGQYFNFKPLMLLVKFIAFFLPIFRRSYVAIIKKQLV